MGIADAPRDRKQRSVSHPYAPPANQAAHMEPLCQAGRSSQALTTPSFDGEDIQDKAAAIAFVNGQANLGPAFRKAFTNVLESSRQPQAVLRVFRKWHRRIARLSEVDIPSDDAFIAQKTRMAALGNVIRFHAETGSALPRGGEVLDCSEQLVRVVEFLCTGEAEKLSKISTQIMRRADFLEAMKRFYAFACLEKIDNGNTSAALKQLAKRLEGQTAVQAYAPPLLAPDLRRLMDVAHYSFAGLQMVALPICQCATGATAEQLAQLRLGDLTDEGPGERLLIKTGNNWFCLQDARQMALLREYRDLLYANGLTANSLLFLSVDNIQRRILGQALANTDGISERVSAAYSKLGLAAGFGADFFSSLSGRSGFLATAAMHSMAISRGLLAKSIDQYVEPRLLELARQEEFSFDTLTSEIAHDMALHAPMPLQDAHKHAWIDVDPQYNEKIRVAIGIPTAALTGHLHEDRVLEVKALAGRRAKKDLGLAATRNLKLPFFENFKNLSTGDWEDAETQLVHVWRLAVQARVFVFDAQNCVTLDSVAAASKFFADKFALVRRVYRPRAEVLTDAEHRKFSMVFRLSSVRTWDVETVVQLQPKIDDLVKRFKDRCVIEAKLQGHVENLVVFVPHNLRRSPWLGEKETVFDLPPSAGLSLGKLLRLWGYENLDQYKKDKQLARSSKDLFKPQTN